MGRFLWNLPTERSYRLLLHLLSPAQREEVKVFGRVTSTGSLGGAYRVTGDHIELLCRGLETRHHHQQGLASICYGPLHESERQLPWPDSVLIRLMALEADEARVLAKGNMGWLVDPSPEVYITLQLDVDGYHARPDAGCYRPDLPMPSGWTERMCAEVRQHLWQARCSWMQASGRPDAAGRAAGGRGPSIGPYRYPADYRFPYPSPRLNEGLLAPLEGTGGTVK